jgi:Spy/CpxP family protein refolding chaperone
MKKIIAFATMMFVVAAATTKLNAQTNDKEPRDKWEKFRAEKVAFLTTELDLTPDEAQKFWPVYNQLEKERWEAHKHRQKLEEKVREAGDNMPEREIVQLTRDYAASMKKEANMMVEYNEKFLKILPPEKVLKLYKAENEFRFQMIKKFRDRRRNGD